MKPTLSIIIPTHRRPAILGQCLQYIERQTIADQLEVIVVGDGPDEKTTVLFAQNTWRIPVYFHEIVKSQQGAARNTGLLHAHGDIVLFIGDDIFLAPDACEKHQKMHRSQKHRPIAVLGYTTWDPACDITPVMRWLEQSGWQFGYPAIAQYAGHPLPSRIQHQYTYTSHISIPLAVAKKNMFQTDVHLYGWEDIEWGMRLCDTGVQLVYEPEARALHHHHITLQQSLQRMETLGKSAKELAKIVPAFDRAPRGWKLLAYRILSLLPTMAGRHKKAFLRGLMTHR